MRDRALLKIHGAKDDVCVPVGETEAVVHAIQAEQTALREATATGAVVAPAASKAPMSIPDVRLTLFETSPAPGSFASCAWMDGHDCWSEAYEVRACFLAIRVLTCLSLYYLVSAYSEYLV